jgi:CubicO group peptidase (beta-lactamase class C family)
MRKCLWLIALVSILPVAALAQVDASVLSDYVEQARLDWNVPGLAVAIVKDNEVVLAQGYGLLEQGRPERVDADTLFAIASNSKAFTAAALAILVDEGKVKWDDRVREHIPYFALYDPYVSEEMRIRDLLCHRSGLGTFSGDLLWYLTSYTREDVVRRARYVKQAGSFRASYGYSNLMFITAGEVIPAVTAKTWDEFLKEQILTPLGMDRTITSVSRLPELGNFATPHSDFEGSLETHEWASWDASAAAAGVISSVNDMTRWIRLQLNRGESEGKRIFSDATSRTMWTPHNSFEVSMGSEQTYPSTHFRGYGLGWSLMDYRGRKVVNHGGAYDGMFSRVALVPEEQLGMVILTNSTTSLPVALMYRILDSYLGGGEKDWSQAGLKRSSAARERSRRKRAARKQSRVPGAQLSLPLAKYTGRFGGDLYGDAVVREEDGKLVLQMLPAPELVADLTHWHYDTFELRWRNSFPWFGKGTVQFLQDHEGKVTEFKMDVPNEDFWFHELEFKKKAN